VWISLNLSMKKRHLRLRTYGGRSPWQVSGVMPEFRLACVSLVIFLRKASPTLSSAWLLKLWAGVTLLQRFERSATWAHFESGPTQPFGILDPLNTMAGIPGGGEGGGFTAAIYSKEWCDLFLLLTVVFSFSTSSLTRALFFA
jgi:hypothetical protein